MQYEWMPMLSILSIISGLVFATLLGLIPATIAKKKGYSFWLWWLYGWLLFGVAIIHVMFISDKQGMEQQNVMPKDNRRDRIYSLLAGLIFLIVSSYYIIQGFRYGWITELVEALYCGALLAFTCVLLIGKRNAAVFATTVFFALINLPNIRFGIYGVLNSYGALLLAILAAGSMLPALKQNAYKMVKRAWFLPAIYFFFDFAVRQSTLVILGLFHEVILLPSTLMKLLEFIGFFVMGLWFQAFPTGGETPKESVIEIYTESYLKNQTGSLGKTSLEVTDSLNTYQSLVDAGLMTKAEFEEKKRQMLEKNKIHPL